MFVLAAVVLLQGTLNFRASINVREDIRITEKAPPSAFTLRHKEKESILASVSQFYATYTWWVITCLANCLNSVLYVKVLVWVSNQENAIRGFLCDYEIFANLRLKLY